VEYLIPFMPLLGSLPLAVAAVLIARLWFRHREGSHELQQRLADLEAEVEGLRNGQQELQERVDFGERLLGQVKDQVRPGPPAG
jgi:hypothetical protein